MCAFVHAQKRAGPPELQFHFQPLSTTGTPAVYLDDFDAFTASVCILRRASRELFSHAESEAGESRASGVAGGWLATRSSDFI